MLGLPTSNEVTESGVVVQHFKTGDIFWNSSVGRRWRDLRSLVGDGWHQELPRPTHRQRTGRERRRASALPERDDVLVTGLERASGLWCDLRLLQRRRRADLATSASPTTGELSVAGGVRHKSSRPATSTWHPSAGTQSVIGAIRTTYNSLGGPAGDLGFPTGGEVPYGTGVLQAYQNGSITWSASAGIQVNVGVSVPYTKEAVFINAVAPMAQASQRKYGVPASVTIARAIHGVRLGHQQPVALRAGVLRRQVRHLERRLRQRHRDAQLGGHRRGGRDPGGPHFRTYNSLADSIMDHGAFLRNNSRYAAAFSTSTPQAFAQAIAAAGYATDPAYASKLANIIRGEQHGPATTRATPWARSRSTARSARCTRWSAEQPAGLGFRWVSRPTARSPAPAWCRSTPA